MRPSTQADEPNNSLDRLPTRWERWLGAAASLLIFLFLALIVAAGTYFALRLPGPVPIGLVIALPGLALLSLWAARMCAKFIWGTPARSRPWAQIVFGFVLAVGSSAYLCAMIVDETRSRPENYASAMFAAVMLASGLTWSRHGWKLRRLRSSGSEIRKSW